MTDVTMCRLEYLTRLGWKQGHAGTNLVHPDKYPERLAANGKVGRVVVLGDDLQPTGVTYESPLHPDPADLPPSVLERLVDTNTAIPRLRPEDEDCEFCLGTLCDGDGECLI